MVLCPSGTRGVDASLTHLNVTVSGRNGHSAHTLFLRIHSTIFNIGDVIIHHHQEIVLGFHSYDIINNASSLCFWEYLLYQMCSDVSLVRDVWLVRSIEYFICLLSTMHLLYRNLYSGLLSIRAMFIICMVFIYSLPVQSVVSEMSCFLCCAESVNFVLFFSLSYTHTFHVLTAINLFTVMPSHSFDFLPAL